MRAVRASARPKPTRAAIFGALLREEILAEVGHAQWVFTIRSKRQPAGAWLLENTHRGKVHFVLEDGDGRPSRWNTLRALRVLGGYYQLAASRTDPLLTATTRCRGNLG